MSFVRAKLNEPEPKWQPLPYDRAIFKSILSWKAANDERKLEYDQQVEAFKSKVAAHEASEDERERKHLAARVSSTFALTRGAI
jgi:hypothetical protein